MTSSCYLFASLPTLFFGKHPGVTYEYFMDVVGRCLSKSKQGRLQRFCYNAPPQCLDNIPSPEKEYWLWEVGLRNELVRIRAERLGVKPGDYLRNVGVGSASVTVAREIMRITDPLEAEEMRTLAGYDWLEMQRGGRVFGFHSLVVYSMQLQILQRYHDFDPVVGRENYQNMYQCIYSKLESVVLEKIV